MPSKTALLLALAAIAGAACHRETKQQEVVTTTTSAARGSGEPGAQQPQPSSAVPQQSPAGVAIGEKMPQFEMALLDGGKFDISNTNGSVVLLNLWATWCGPCRQEIPELERMHKAHAADGFKVVGVSLDDTGVEAVKEFVAQHEMTYPIALDPENRMTGILRTSVIPTTVLIDRSGTVVWKKYEIIPPGDKELEEALKKALAEKRT